MNNPTTGQSQFTNPIHLDNVTPGAPLQSPILGIPQFANPIHLDADTFETFPNPTLTISQFDNPIHLDADTFETFPNPTLGIRQFKDPIHLDVGLLPIPNPTLTGNLSKETAIHLDGNTPVTFPNPTLFATPTQFTEEWDINNNNEAIDGSGTGTGINDTPYPSPLDQTPLDPRSGVPLPTQYNTDESSFYYSGELNERYRNWNPAAGTLGQSQETRGYESSNFVPPAFVGTVASNVGARLGIPFASSIVNTSISNYTIFDTPFRTLPFNKLNTKITPNLGIGGRNLDSIVEFLDFRSRFSTTIQGENTEGGVFRGDNVENALSFLSNKRADGSFAVARNLALKKSVLSVSNLIDAGRPAAYAAAAISPAGAYSIFNLKASGQFGSGWGDHDNPYAIRNDFTAGSEVSTVWYKKTGWNNALAKVNPDALLPFRGDKVNVIDFKRHDNNIDGSGRTLKEAYQWKKTWLKGNGTNNNIVQQIIGSDTLTKDFIKFYLTGPKLQNGLATQRDDIMVFRASISSLRDQFQPQWTPNTLIGRADPNYTYGGYSRDFSLNFDVFATSRDELKFIWRKLNALAGYTTPEYDISDSGNIALRAPWMRLTVGDLFVQQPVVLQSLSFDYDTEASWEINIEGDGTNMQVPFKIGVSCQFNMITDYLPQKGGRFFTLAKRFDADGHPYEGTDNWLSDFLGNVESPDIINNKKKNNNGPTELSDVQDVTGQSGTANSKKGDN